MIQEHFIRNILTVIKADDTITGLTVGGSWLTNEMDEYSDLDLILVTKEKVSDNREMMFSYARSFGKFLSGFTGEHVGEPRLLICLYDDPLLHVDIKFLTLTEFYSRVEDPAILHDTDGQLEKILSETAARYQLPDYQWMEDRFWIWIHYATLKIGRGEWMEALDFFAFIRMTILGPLLQIKNGQLPRGVRKVETGLVKPDLEKLILTIPVYERAAIITALKNSIILYDELSKQLFGEDIKRQTETATKAIEYLRTVEEKK
ncbi:nucleotidyltransferase domain-containing protein [Chitinophaga sp. MM2321]|uniref:nucleotidyltransferase domain-containing protein n=1 Tax=Chitinophaga sp. MM2321 TaxID=3137178 RepID=UPI0032D5A266